MLKTCTASAVAALASLVFVASPADAAIVRAWVSGHGSDAAGCGSPASPCRTLQYAFTNIVSPGGEIDILDPAGYGTLTINHSISIVNDGVGTAGVQAASGAAITITAAINDVIHLRGLNIEGLGAASEGINYQGGSQLNIEHCVIHGFAYGLSSQWDQNYTINVVDSVIANNFQDGISLLPIGGAFVGLTMAHVQLLNNGSNNGGTNIHIYTSSSNFGGAVRAGITDSVFNGATSSILLGVAGSMPVFVSIANSLISGATTGISADGAGATALVSRTTLSGNVSPFKLTNSGVLKSYGNNDMADNVNQGTGTLGAATPR